MTGPIVSVKHGADKTFCFCRFARGGCFFLGSKIRNRRGSSYKELRLEVFRCDLRGNVRGECCSGSKELLAPVSSRRSSPGLCFGFCCDMCGDIRSKRCGGGKKLLMKVVSVMRQPSAPATAAYVHPRVSRHGLAAVCRRCWCAAPSDPKSRTVARQHRNGSIRMRLS